MPIVLEIPEYQIKYFDIRLSEMINLERENLKLPKLTLSDFNSCIAAINSTEMAINKKAAHNNYNKISKYLDPILVGEVLSPKRQQPESVLQGWLDSDDHRACILNKVYNKIGIANHFDSDGKRYVCAILTN